MLHRLLLISIFVHFAFFSDAQQIDEKKFRLITTKNSLSDNYVTGVQQDSTGYIWISTHRGLNRYDGNLFKQFFHDSDPRSIPDNYIFSMQLFPDGQLAIATSDGAQLISTNTLQTKKLEIPNPEALKYWSNDSRYINRDQDGNFGVSTKTGFYIFSPAGDLKNRFDFYRISDIGKTWMSFGQRVHRFPGGNLVQQNSSEMLVYNRKKNNFGNAVGDFPALKTVFSPQSNQHELFLIISSVYLLKFSGEKNTFDLVDMRNGNVRSFPAPFKIFQEIGWQTNPMFVGNKRWALNSRYKGFYLLHIDTSSGTISCDPKKYFNGYSCNIIFSDNQQRLWVGTTEGLFMENIHPKIISSFTIPGKEDVFTALLIEKDKIIAGTDQKQVYIIEKKTWRILAHIKLPIVAGISNRISEFRFVSPDTLWAATTSGLMWLNLKNLSSGFVFPAEYHWSASSVHFLFPDHENNIWFPGEPLNNLLFYNLGRKTFDSLNANTDRRMIVNFVNGLAEDRSGNLWIGGDAIVRWNKVLKKIDTVIEQISTQSNRKKGFRVMGDSKKNIWIALKDDGFVKISGSGALLHVRPTNLVPDINQIAFTTLLNDRIYAPIRNGFGLFDLKDLKSIVFTNADGLPDKPVTTFYFNADSTDNSTWFACEDVICKLPFDTSGKFNSSPTLHIAEVSLPDSTFNNPSGTIYLNHDQNNLKISFSAINYDDPINMRFAYRVINRKDSSWIEAGTQPNILLTNISPGDYKLQVKVYAYDNKWPDQTTELAIRIDPPFWKTWWFISIIALVVIAAVYSIYKRRVNQIEEKANIDKQLMELEMKALHAQMNPHFIFNCLNSIKEMILHDEKQNASRYLSKFAQLIRITLEESKEPLITVKQCVDHLLQYLDMEKIRFSEFNYNIEVERELPINEIHIAPMLVQPLVENAIWHGLQKQTGEKNLNIRLYRKENQLVCEIEDNGIGIRQSQENKTGLHPAHRSVGIDNIKERLVVLNEKYKMNCSLTIKDRSDIPGGKKGTLAVLSLNM